MRYILISLSCFTKVRKNKDIARKGIAHREIKIDNANAVLQLLSLIYITFIEYLECDLRNIPEEAEYMLISHYFAPRGLIRRTLKFLLYILLLSYMPGTPRGLHLLGPGTKPPSYSREFAKYEGRFLSIP